MYCIHPLTREFQVTGEHNWWWQLEIRAIVTPASWWVACMRNMYASRHSWESASFRDLSLVSSSSCDKCPTSCLLTVSSKNVCHCFVLETQVFGIFHSDEKINELALEMKSRKVRKWEEIVHEFHQNVIEIIVFVDISFVSLIWTWKVGISPSSIKVGGALLFTLFWLTWIKRRLLLPRHESWQEWQYLKIRHRRRIND